MESELEKLADEKDLKTNSVLMEKKSTTHLAEMESQLDKLAIDDEKDNIHPLLIEEVVDVVLSFFTDDQANLRQLRLVCQLWNLSASHIIKESYEWEIVASNGVKGPKQFTELMVNSNNDLLKNICIIDEISVPQAWKPLYEHLSIRHGLHGGVDEHGDGAVSFDQFVSAFGPKIVQLRLEADFTSKYHWINDLPNLESLHILILQYFRSWLKFSTAARFLKLKTLKLTVLSPEIIAQKFTPVLKLDNFPHVENLTIYGRLEVHNKLAQCTEETLARLTTLKLLPFTPLGSTNAAEIRIQGYQGLSRKSCLSVKDLEAIHHKCKNLKTLSCPIVLKTEDYKDRMKNILNDLSAKFEQLELFPVVKLNYDANAYASPVYPQLCGIYFEHLTTLRICHPYTSFKSLICNFNFNMPKLKAVVELYSNLATIQDSATIDHTDGHPVYETVTELRLRHARNLVEDDFMALSSYFPNVSHLHMYANDEMLQLIFVYMPHLTKLYIRAWSGITDSGITGIPAFELAWFPSNGEIGQEVVEEFRSNPFIGDLKDLEVFSYHRYYGQTLSNKSNEYGFKYLTKLVELDVPSSALE